MRERYDVIVLRSSFQNSPKVRSHPRYTNKKEVFVNIRCQVGDKFDKEILGEVLDGVKADSAKVKIIA